MNDRRKFSRQKLAGLEYHIRRLKIPFDSFWKESKFSYDDALTNRIIVGVYGATPRYALVKARTGAGFMLFINKGEGFQLFSPEGNEKKKLTFAALRAAIKKSNGTLGKVFVPDLSASSQETAEDVSLAASARVADKVSLSKFRGIEKLFVGERVGEDSDWQESKYSKQSFDNDTRFLAGFYGSEPRWVIYKVSGRGAEFYINKGQKFEYVSNVSKMAEFKGVVMAEFGSLGTVKAPKRILMKSPQEKRTINRLKKEKKDRSGVRLKLVLQYVQKILIQNMKTFQVLMSNDVKEYFDSISDAIKYPTKMSDTIRSSSRKFSNKAQERCRLLESFGEYLSQIIGVTWRDDERVDPDKIIPLEDVKYMKDKIEKALSLTGT